jgi:hypothetical protein
MYKKEISFWYIGITTFFRRYLCRINLENPSLRLPVLACWACQHAQRSARLMTLRLILSLDGLSLTKRNN